VNSVSKLHVIDHPLVQHKIAFIRDSETGPKEFRELVDEVSLLMAYEVTRDLPLTSVQVQTPVAEAKCQVIAGKKIGIVPILRAGLGMVSGMLRLIPAARIGHIGVYRDLNTLQPVEYYCKLPKDINERELIVVDPMLATGGSAIATIRFIKEHGGRSIKFMCLIAAPEGIKALQSAHPDVDIFAAAVDDHLNEHGYIVPGLGDAGDRLFGTK
jgi:uracil phosphoribosyltransferase